MLLRGQELSGEGGRKSRAEGHPFVHPKSWGKGCGGLPCRVEEDGRRPRVALVWNPCMFEKEGFSRVAPLGKSLVLMRKKIAARSGRGRGCVWTRYSAVLGALQHQTCSPFPGPIVWRLFLRSLAQSCHLENQAGRRHSGSSPVGTAPKQVRNVGSLRLGRIHVRPSGSLAHFHGEITRVALLEAPKGRQKTRRVSL